MDHGLRVVKMSLSSIAVVKLTLVVDERHVLGVLGERLLVQAADVHVQRREVRAAQTGGCPGETSVHDLVSQTHGLEHLETY